MRMSWERRVATRNNDQATRYARKSSPQEVRKALKFPCVTLMEGKFFSRECDPRECDLQFKGESTHTLFWKIDGAWLGINSRD